MRIDQDTKLDYKDVLIRPKRSTLKSRKQVRVERTFRFRNYEANFPVKTTEDDFNGIPIMAANMDGVGTFEMADTLAKQKMFTCLVKTYNVNELIEFFNADLDTRTQNVAMSIGSSEADFTKLTEVYSAVTNSLKYVCMDIANGYSDHFAQHVRKVRENFPNIVIIAGNVVTGEMTEELILAGADIVKVGIGPGSVCTTRIQTGVGYPQLSAVIECADAAHGLGGHIIADGGCTCPGDVAKAFAGGADFVMLGGMLAGHDEGGGEVITKYYSTGEHFFMSNDNSYQPVIENKKLQLLANSATKGSAVEELDVQFSHEKLEIGFNSRYLLDIISEIDGNDVTLNFSDPAAPVLIIDDAEDNLFFVLMPMRI